MTDPSPRDLSRPTAPSRAYTDHIAADTARRQSQAAPADELGDGQGAPAAWRDAARAALSQLKGSIIGLSRDIHAHPELGNNEFYALAAVGALLDVHGIAHEDGVFGVPTALRAQVGRGTGEGGRFQQAGSPSYAGRAGPTVAILCEYDALPGIGHGCGHNVMAAQAVGAFLALARVDAELAGGLPGRVILQTTPAEENATTKEILAQAGAFDGLDAAIMAHSYGRDVAHQQWLGVRRFRVVYHGVPAHASSAPFMGRNALDAATLALTGLGLLRQHIGVSDRLHAVITDGGLVPNVIPERAALSVYVRSAHVDTLVDLVGRVRDVFEGAAVMTGTGVEFDFDATTNEMPVRANGPLLASWVRSQRDRGREPLPLGVVPESIAAGTDFGNVSLRVPGIHPLVSIGDHSLMLHTREMAEAAGGRGGDLAALDGAYGLAAVALDVLADERFRREVWADFEAAGGVVDVARVWDSR